MAQLALVGGIFLLALLAGFVPFISIEVALLVTAGTHGSTRLLLALAIAAALGMMVGKTCFFVGGRSASGSSRRSAASIAMKRPFSASTSRECRA